MKPIHKRLLVTSVIALAVGALAIVPVVTSYNGYVAGFAFLPLFVLVCCVAFVLLVAGLITITKKVGPPLLLAAALIPVGFFGAAMISKQLELGAYKEDPMVPLIPEAANIVRFKKDTTEEQISVFWNETLATEREDKRGFEHLPGLQGVARLFPRDGREVVAFSFHAGATDEQRQYVYQRVRSSPIVYELRENVSTEDYMPSNASNPNRTDNRPTKKVVHKRGQID
jgi:hypothetical protein